MTFGSLFAGVGGFDLGFEKAGLRCEWQVEINEYCKRVLAKLWPSVYRWDDVRTFPPERWEPCDRCNGRGWYLERFSDNHGTMCSRCRGARKLRHDWTVDVICGGFPCQDISYAGKGAGLAGERSGLWSEFLRIIRLIRPRYVVVENVPALLDRGLGDVLADLASCGFDAEWDCLPASAFGAYHERDRVFVVAYPAQQHGDSWHLLEASAEWRAQIQSGRFHRMAMAARGEARNERLECEPELVRLVHGVPNRTHRLEGLGNAVYPAVAEWIGRRLMQAVEPIPVDMVFDELGLRPLEGNGNG